MLHPTSVTQAEGVDATFLCQYPQAAGINWIVNGTALNQLNPRPQEIGDVANSLKITALPNYNSTEIKCIATLLNGTVAMTELSSTATLTVQGMIL